MKDKIKDRLKLITNPATKLELMIKNGLVEEAEQLIADLAQAGYVYFTEDVDRKEVFFDTLTEVEPSRGLIDTGNMLDTDRQSTIGLESFWINGPFKLQGEYMKTTVDRYASADDFSGTGGYVSGVWNVTGEHFSNKAGIPGTPGATNPASGMWQVGLRYDTMDLDDGVVLGGRMDTITAGVNWYWRSNFKVGLNYVKVDSERRGVEDNPNALEARLQFYW